MFITHLFTSYLLITNMIKNLVTKRDYLCEKIITAMILL